MITPKMSSRKLFLLGGSEAFDAVAAEFVPAAGGRDSKIVVLMQNREGWEKYGSEYVQPWIRKGVSQYDSIAPDEQGVLDLDAASTKLREATGIFIGGGHTPTYHQLYATGPIRGMIQERYREGIPVAGVSAGALIALQVCVLFPEAEGDVLQIVPGLDLVKDFMAGVHFSERNALPELVEAMVKTRTKRGWGIDGAACAVFEDRAFKGVIGRSVYEITMEDFDAKTHKMAERTTVYSRWGVA
jgi:cyanophycinase